MGQGNVIVYTIDKKIVSGSSISTPDTFTHIAQEYSLRLIRVEASLVFVDLTPFLRHRNMGLVPIAYLLFLDETNASQGLLNDVNRFENRCYLRISNIANQ